MEEWQVIRRHALEWPDRRVLVCGPTRYDDWDLLKSVLQLSNPGTVVHGHGTGVDHLASLYAQMFHLNEMRFPADWRLHGLNAAIIRNDEMFAHGDPDIVIAFPGGPNCNDITRRARLAGIPVVSIEGDHWMAALQADASREVRARA